jgi:hypothetical protein
MDFMNSEVVFLFMCDTGSTFLDEQLSGLLKNQEDFSKYEYTKPGPEEIATFNVPTIFNLKDETLTIENTTYTFKMQASIYGFGGLSIRARYTFSGGYDVLSKLTFDKAINDFINGITSKAKKRVITSLAKISPVKESNLTETYKFYYIEGNKQSVIKRHKKLIAGLLIDEQDVDTLEDNYVESVLSKSIAYDNSNVLFVGWEGAVMIDTEYVHEHELLMAEIASLELLETRIHHEILVQKLKEAKGGLEKESESVFSFLGSPKMKMLNESLGKSYETSKTILNNVQDTAYGFGEWYLSRVYSLFSDVFKLEVIEEMLQRDLDAIDNEREFVDDILDVRHENFLEYIVILLIAIEIILELAYFLK